MPRKKPTVAEMYAQACSAPRPAPEPVPPDKAEVRAILKQCRAGFDRFWQILKLCELDAQTKEALARAFADTVGSMIRQSRLRDKFEDEIREWLLGSLQSLYPIARKFVNQRTGPQSKRQLVNKRHEVMKAAIAQGIEGQKLYKFMLAEHSELMRKNKRGDFIGLKQMMQQFAASMEI